MHGESVWYDGSKGGPIRSGLKACENIGFSVCLGSEGLEKMSGYTSVHEEVFTIPWMFKKNSKLRTRFIYRPSPQMSESLLAAKWVATKNLHKARNIRCLDTDTKPDGFDAVGTYVTTEDGFNQWVGLKCTAQQSWETWGQIGQATSWLTALGVMAAINVCLKSPDLGVCTPEDVPLNMVLPYMKPFLHSLPADNLTSESSCNSANK